MISPHGSKTLKTLLLEGKEKNEELKRAESLPQLQVSSRETGDLIMMGIGGFTPIDGFMGKDDWKGVCEEMKMTNGIFWPIPITLSQDEKLAAGTEVALVSEETNEIMATMKVTESYQIDKELECKNVFTTTDAEHPGVQMVQNQKAWNIAGPVKVLSESYFPTEFKGIYQRPAESRKIFEEKGWKTIAALQLRNPMHRSHEFLAKIAVEVSDGIYIHQLVGKLKPGDIPAEVRVKCIDTLVENYFVKERVVTGGYPLDMRYAGPREGLLHGVFRQNFGCTHMIIGRDHAGVGDYYGPFDAQDVLPPALGGRPGVQDAADRLDVLLPRLRRHGVDEDLSPLQGGSGHAERDSAAQGAFRGRRCPVRIQSEGGSRHSPRVLRRFGGEGRGQAARSRDRGSWSEEVEIPGLGVINSRLSKGGFFHA